MSSEDEQELRDDTLQAAFWIPVTGASVLLIMPVLMLQAANQREIRTRNAKRTKWLMLGVIASNTAAASIFFVRMLVCGGYCNILIGIQGALGKILLRIFNLLFLVHRAKLAQGMTPILSKKWFEKILPTIIVVVFSGFLLIGLTSTAETNYACSPYEDWSDVSICNPIVDPDAQVDERTFKAFVVAMIALDVLITAILMTLFIIPLYRVYRAGLGQLNRNQLRQKTKLKELLLWSTVMTFINQITTTFLWLPSLHYSLATHVLGVVGLFDSPINVWTAWLMVTSNRQYLRRQCRSICKGRHGETDMRREMSGLTNVPSLPSRSATLLGIKTSQLSVDIASIRMSASEENLTAHVPHLKSKL